VNYKNLEQRMIATYIATFPPFLPAIAGEASKDSQREFYEFMQRAYQEIYNHTELLFAGSNEDDAYLSRFNKGKDNKPLLIKWMKKDKKEIDALLSNLFLWGQEGNVDENKLVFADAVKVNKKYLSLLPQIGLRVENNVLTHDKYNDLFPAWKWMATRPDASIFTFSRCIFDQNHSYASDIFGSLLDQKSYHILENYLIKSGYNRVDRYSDCANFGFTNNTFVNLDYVKKHGISDLPLGDFVYDHFHTGIAIDYSFIMKDPLLLGLRILRMKEIIEKFALMSDELQDFMIKYGHRCDSCDYCIQRNKSRVANPKRFFITVEHGGKKYNLCPLFPGYYFCWNALDEELVRGIIAFLSFMDSQIFIEGE